MNTRTTWHRSRCSASWSGSDFRLLARLQPLRQGALRPRQAGRQKEGKQEGEADAILLVLEARGLDVSDAERERITSCTDLKQLKRWIIRAATAEKTGDLFG